jgi:hypothetical protein
MKGKCMFGTCGIVNFSETNPPGRMNDDVFEFCSKQFIGEFRGCSVPDDEIRYLENNK